MLFSLPWPFRSANSSDQDHDKTTDPEQVENSQQNEYAKLLQHYDAAAANNVLPPSARVDPTLVQQERRPMGLFDVWKYGFFLATKATEIMTSVVSHHVWGPRRKTWGIEMTLITSFMRNASQHSQLTDIIMLRRLISLIGFVPLPSDAMVTPVTFRVRKRKLRGFLEKCSIAEDGSRELAGEWVVGKRLWRNLQTQWKTLQTSNQTERASAGLRHRTDRVVLYLHGGAYYMFSAATHRLITIQLSKQVEARVFVLDYRLAPETRFPGQLHDAVCAYLRLIEDLKIPAENIIIAGDSAGGGLSLALLLYLRDNQYPLPSGAILMSPWVDLTMSCDSWDSNADYDVVPLPKPGDHLNPVSCFLGQEGMEKYLTHPYVSPLFGDFKGLPPLLIQAGDSEVLRDEITLLAHKASQAGVTVRHELYDDAVHVFQTFPFLETSRKAFAACRDFVKNDLPMHQRHSPQELDKNTIEELEREIANERSRLVRGDGQEMATESTSQEDVIHDEISPELGDVEEESSWTRSSSRFFESSTHFEEEIRPKDSTMKPRKTTTGTNQAPASSSIVVNPVADAREDTPYIPTRPRNHIRRATGSQIRLPALTMSPSISTAPVPTIRSRNRAISHPDISSLCQAWASTGPANRTTRYSSVTPSTPN